MPFRLLTVAGLATLAASLSAAEPDREPALEVTIEIDGQAVEAQVGGTAEVSIDGKPRTVKLTAKPTRRLAKAGVEFLYPSYFTYEFDDSTPGARLYTVEGPAATVMVQDFGANDVSSEEMVKSVLEGMREAYGEALGEETDVRIRLEGKDVRGRRLAANFAGASLRQDVFGIADTKTVLVVQTLLNDDGSEPDEAKLVRKLLAETFRVTEPAAAQ